MVSMRLTKACAAPHAYERHRKAHPTVRRVKEFQNRASDEKVQSFGAPVDRRRPVPSSPPRCQITKPSVPTSPSDGAAHRAPEGE